MTDKERTDELTQKAKKYFEDSKDYYDSREPITDRQLRQIYLDGLAEGKKETESHLLENWCRNEDDYCPHLKKLEKENEELKAQIERISVTNFSVIEKLKEQKKDLCESLDIMNNRESELLEQIEKMKCCKNCKNWNWKHNKCEKKLKGNCIKNSKWELAE